MKLHLRIGIFSEVGLPKTNTPETEATQLPTVWEGPGSFSTSLAVGTTYYFSSFKFFWGNDLKKPIMLSSELYQEIKVTSAVQSKKSVSPKQCHFRRWPFCRWQSLWLGASLKFWTRDSPLAFTSLENLASPLGGLMIEAKFCLKFLVSMWSKASHGLFPELQVPPLSMKSWFWVHVNTLWKEIGKKNA